MNLKRLLITLVALFFTGALSYGEIAIKDLGNGQVDITFTFKDSSSEMGVIGSFDNWTVPGEAMTKNDAGLWEKTIQAGNADVITYKFYSKGSWIFDERAPDKKDDGYGGFNGLIPVADILAGVLPAVPGAAPLPPPKAGPKVATRPKLAFGTTTFVESTSTFSTSSGMDLKETGLTAKSIWKLQGDLITGMPAYLEVTAFNGAPKIMTKDGLEVDEGLEALSAGFLFNPFYYLGGNKRPTLDKLRFGFDTPYLLYETGYGSAPLPLHQGILWKTVSKDTASGSGYSAFLLGPKAKSWGEFTVDAGIVPNRSLGGSYGLYSWASVEAFGVKVEGQYNLKSGTTTDASKYFDKPARQDYVAGVDAFWEGIVLQGQWLNSLFGEGISGNDLPAADRTAYKVVAGYRDSYGDAEFLFGYAYRGGVATQLLFLNKDDNNSELGGNSDFDGQAMTTLSFKGFQKVGYWGNFKLEASSAKPLAKSSQVNVASWVRPSVWVDFEKLELFPVAVEVYAKVAANSVADATHDKLALVNTGAKVSVQGLDVYLKSDPSVKDSSLQTVLGEAKVAPDFKVQAGLGLRSGSAAKSTLGFALGAYTVLPFPEAKSPKVYSNLVYNMDPYNGAGVSSFDLTDFGPTSATAGMDGLATLRFGVAWDY